MLMSLSGSRREQNHKQIKNQEHLDQFQFPNHPCNEAVENVVLIKTHKTGSTTLAHIVNRFGYSRKLLFLLPKDVRYGRSFIWELGSTQGARDFLLPSLRYNMFTLHTTYNRKAMDTLMVPDAKYITSVRDPVEQFESAFVYYKFFLALPERFQEANIQTAAKIEEWLRLSQFYTARYERIVKNGDVKTPNSELYCHNSQMRDLGLDMKNQEVKETVLKHISTLEQQFNFFVITEYFDESLIVLMREFCWNMEDILYIPENQRPDQIRTTSLPEHLRQAIREWNSADQLLYEQVNRTLWRKIADYGDGFQSDLEMFRQNLKMVLKNCVKEKQDKLDFSRVKYVMKKNSPEYCKLMTVTKNQLMEKIRKRQELTESVA